MFGSSPWVVDDGRPIWTPATAAGVKSSGASWRLVANGLGRRRRPLSYSGKEKS
jgi:hypothetical protein